MKLNTEFGFEKAMTMLAGMVFMAAIINVAFGNHIKGIVSMIVTMLCLIAGAIKFDKPSLKATTQTKNKEVEVK